MDDLPEKLKILRNEDEIEPRIPFEDVPPERNLSRSDAEDEWTPQKMKARFDGTSILNRIGQEGLATIVIRSAPGWPEKLLSVPYGLFKWGRMLHRAHSRGEFKSMHLEEQARNGIYRALSPKYHRAGPLLKRVYEIE